MKTRLKLIIIEEMIKLYSKGYKKGICFAIKDVINDELMLSLFPELSSLNTKLAYLAKEIPEVFEAIFAEQHQAFQVWNKNDIQTRIDYLVDIRNLIINNINARRLI